VKIDHAWHFSGTSSVPTAFQGSGPYDLTLDQLAALTKDYAVLLYKDTAGDTVIAFDTHRGRFKQR
jgi:hypothetical protein